MSFLLNIDRRRNSASSSSASPRISPAVKPMVFESNEAAYRYERAPAYAAPKWTGDIEDDEPYKELNYDYDEDEDEDDLDQEPALTSDDATMPSSSRAPSLSPTSAHDDDAENVYVDVVPSSPTRDSFVRPRPAAMHVEKSTTQEDVVAALLSLARPRIGPSPLASTFPPLPMHRPVSTTCVNKVPAPPLRIAVPTPRSPPRRSPEEEHREALIDPCSPARYDLPQTPIVRASSLAALLNPEPACPSLQHARSATPERIYSPLPPSSPLSEEERDEGDALENPAPAVDDSADKPHVPASKFSSPLSRLSSLPPSSPITESAPPHSVVLIPLSPLSSPISESDALPAFELGTLSPLSSPPSSPQVLPVIATSEVSLKRPTSTAPNASGSRKKRKVENDTENIPVINLPPQCTLPPTVAQTVRVIKTEPTVKKRKPNADVDAVARKKKKRVSEDTAPKSPRSPQKQKQKASAGEGTPSDADCPHSALLSLLIESLALSRASSLPISALYDSIRASYPSLPAIPPHSSHPSSSHPPKSTRTSRGTSDPTQTPPRGAMAQDKIKDTVLSTDALSAVLTWGIQRGLFGELASSGDSVPPTYFYLPAADWDRARAGLWEAMGGRGKRAAARGYKQYYWQPVVLPRGGRRRKGRIVEEGGAGAGWEVDWEE